MRTITIAALAIAVSTVSFAQLIERAPIAGKELERSADRFAHKKAVDEAFADKPMRTPRLTAAARDSLLGDYTPPAPIDVAYGEFVTAGGKYFVAMHFAPPPDLVLPKDKKLTFFGMVQNQEKKTVWSYEQEVVLAEGKNGPYHEQSVALPAENVTGAFGFAVKGEPVAMTIVPMQLSPVATSMRRVSRLLVSNDVFTLTKPQGPVDPFAFGGIKVVPRANRAFKSSDELWLFFEAQNPALAGDGTPKLTTKVDVESLSAENPKKIRGATNAAQVLPLKGVPGHFGVGTTVDISRLTPGEYRVRVNVTDALAPATYELLETIRVVAN